MFKNWRALLLLSFFLAFFGLFFYFFVLEKNIIQFVSTNQTLRKASSKQTKTYQVKKHPSFPEQVHNWKQLKPFLQTFLRRLFPPTTNLFPFLKLQYEYQTRNQYHLRPVINQSEFEKYVLTAIRDQVSFYDYKVAFSYSRNYLTVKIKLSVLKKPTQTVTQLYQLQSIAV